MKRLYGVLFLLFAANIFTAESERYLPVTDTQESGYNSRSDVTPEPESSSYDEEDSSEEEEIAEEEALVILAKLDNFLDAKEKSIINEHLISLRIGIDPADVQLSAEESWNVFKQKFRTSINNFLQSLPISGEYPGMQKRIERAVSIINKFNKELEKTFSSAYYRYLENEMEMEKVRKEQQEIKENFVRSKAWIEERIAKKNQNITDVCSNFRMYIESKMVEAYQRSVKLNRPYTDSLREIYLTAFLLWNEYLKIFNNNKPDADVWFRNKMAFTAGRTLLKQFKYYNNLIKKNLESDRFIDEDEQLIEGNKVILMGNIEAFMEKFKV